MSRITTDEVHAYGPELLDVVQRAALDKIEPHLVALQRENQNLRQRVAAGDARDTYALLDDEFGSHWRDWNQDPEFLNWLKLSDPLSGLNRHQLLTAAFASGDSARVRNFFAGFFSERAATASTRPARSSAPRDEKPMFTSAQVAHFYAEGRGRTFTAEQQKQRDATERQIIAAGAEGRIVR
jgi:hypothetical protein